MAKVEVVTTVCDHCGGVEDVRSRQLREMDSKRQATFDACAECRRTVPLDEWEKLIPAKGSRTRTVGRRVLNTPEQLEAAKKKSRKKG